MTALSQNRYSGLRLPLPQPRPEVWDLATAVHGGPDLDELARLGLNPDEVLDFSANINPYGPAPGVRAALAQTRIDRYPDPQARVLRRALSEHLNVAPRQILAGNGSSELIWLAVLAFLRPGDRVVVLGPTYCEYGRAAALMGAAVITCAAPEDNQFTVNAADVCRSLSHYQPRLVFACNPNNPTGATIAADDISSWADRHPHSLFIIDEAYLPFADDTDSAISLRATNVLVLRSMTKDFGLAGLRLGYAVGPEELIACLVRVKPPWSVNAFAQSAGVAALRDPRYYRRTLAALGRAKADLIGGLKALDFQVVPSTTLFFLVRVGDGRSFREGLLKRGILVRDCASFGLSGQVRIATRRPEENARLLSAIRRIHRPEEASHAG
jgi:histidinol-phosphate aminotransferase